MCFRILCKVTLSEYISPKKQINDKYNVLGKARFIKGSLREQISTMKSEEQS